MRIWTEESGGIQYRWVRLDGEPARCVGYVSGRDAISPDEAVVIARRMADSARLEREAEARLRALRPDAQLYGAWSCPADVDPASWPTDDNSHVLFTLRPRRRRGYHVIDVYEIL